MRITALATALLLAFPAFAAAASQGVSLERVAGSAGYHYAYSQVSALAVLTRPGIAVVIRPGATVYQVNGREEATNWAPLYTGGTLYVSQSLAARLEELARHASTAPAQSPVSVPYDRTVQGQVTLEARQLQGAEAIDVQGTAPAGAPVTITLMALISPDLPTVLVSRHDIVSDVNGRFGAVIPIASAYERGIVLTVIATSAPGVASAQAQLTTSAPNAGASVPLEH